MLYVDMRLMHKGEKSKVRPYPPGEYTVTMTVGEHGEIMSKSHDILVSLSGSVIHKNKQTFKQFSEGE